MMELHIAPDFTFPAEEATTGTFSLLGVRGLIADLEAKENEVNRAFSMLEANGVPRERAKTVANGIDVLATRLSKEVQTLEEVICRLRAVLEAEAVSHDRLEAGDMLIGGPANLRRYHREHAAVLRGALAGKDEETVRKEMDGE
jgi:hypothetical protein